MNDPNLPRAWSKYSKEKETQEAQNRQPEKKFENDKKSGFEEDNPLNLLNQVSEDPKLLEYLETMKSRTKAKTWANDDNYMMKSTNTTDDSNVKVILPVKDDDDEYQDLPLKNKDNDEQDNEDNDEGSDLDKEEEEEAEKDEMVHDENISDMDYLKSRMATSGKSLLELTENDDLDMANLEPEVKEESGEEVDLDSEEDSKTKQSNQEVSNEHANQEPNSLPSNLSDEAKILDNGRLFLRNLAYTCTEDHLKDLFGPFGQLQEVHLPIDKFTKKPLGTAYIQFVMPSHAFEAFKNLSGTSFLGRLLHVLPAQDKIEKDLTADAQNMSLKDKRALEKKLKADKDFNWNSLFMSQDAVAESIADRLGVSKKDVLDPESKNVAIRLALAETNIVNETKQYLIDVNFY
jgi:multiple RNA-binding domain-containing protein 1